MKKALLMLGVLSVLVTWSFCSQTIAATPTAQWEKTFGGTGEDYFLTVSPTDDGGFILTGVTDSYGAGSKDVYLVKTDSSGNEQWPEPKTFGGTGYNVGYTAQQTTDGGYIVGGYFNTETEACLIKTSSDGTSEWQNIYTMGSGIDTCFSVQQTTDGGYIFTGMTNSGAGDKDIPLVKTDASGNQLWSTTFGGTNKEHGTWVRQTKDGGYIIAGDSRSFGETGSDVYLVKTDSDGDSLWEKTFDISLDDQAYCVQELDDGYIITGISDYLTGSDDIFLLKTDSAGNKIWEQSFGGSSTEHGRSVLQTLDGGFIIAGYTNSYGAGDYDGYLIKTDSSGIMEWDKTFGGELRDAFFSVQQISGSEYIAAGLLTSVYGGGNSDAYLVSVVPEPATLLLLGLGSLVLRRRK